MIEFASRHWKTALKILAVAALLYAAGHLSKMVAEAIEFELRPSNEDVVNRVITISAFLYAGLLALPFVPGAEIGLALLMAFGPPIAFLVYTCTVAGLCLSFLMGRFVPLKVLKTLADAINLSRLAGLLEQLEPMARKDRIDFLLSLDDRFAPILLRYRYVGLALLFNLPGNFLIGGGGGIGLIAGMSGIYSVSGFMATVMIAVSPVPILVSAFGTGFLS